MNLPDLAVSLALAAFCVALLALYRTRYRPAPGVHSDRMDLRPTGHLHRIAAFTSDGKHPLPDVYLGDSDKDVKRKWDALKQRKNTGHWELWHARHGRRDTITRSIT